MMRFAVFALLIPAILPLPAHAQNAAPDSENGRYTLSRVDDDYLRLDTRSGQVSVCTRRSVGWACHPVPDERSALEAEIGRLQGDNAALKQDLLSRGLALPGSIKADPPIARAPDLKVPDILPKQEDVDRVMSFVERVWKRLVEMIDNVQRDIQKKT